MSNRTAKIEWREEVVSALDKSTSIFLTQCSGLTVADLTQFRRTLKSVNAEFHIVKNTVAKKALAGRTEAAVIDLFKGQTGVIFAFGDAGAAAKKISEAAKENEKLVVVGGFLDGSALDAKAIGKIADLPTREVLIAKILGAMVAPHKGLLNVLNGVPRQMVQVISAIKDQKAG